MYRIVNEFGKKGIEVLENDKISEFFPEPQIAISPRIPAPADIEKIDIPEYERGVHYRVSQCYFFYQRYKIEAEKTGKSPFEINPSAETAQRWEKEFRFRYYEQFKRNKHDF